MAVDVSEQRVLQELTGMLREATGETGDWADRITPATRLDDDLHLESVELTVLAELVQRRYGPEVDLAGYVAALDVDELLALTVGDLVELVARRVPAAGEPAGEAAR